MAASKSKNTGHSGRNTKKKTAMEQEVGRFQTEIILFVILAACVILMASNFGAGGFALAGPRAARFVSGFSTLSPTQRSRYDTAAISRDYVRRFLGWGVLLLVGAGGSVLWNGWTAALALIFWQLLFWRQVHWNPEEEFSDYLIKETSKE